jgi:hypothetical protein
MRNKIEPLKNLLWQQHSYTLKTNYALILHLTKFALPWHRPELMNTTVTPSVSTEVSHTGTQISLGQCILSLGCENMWSVRSSLVLQKNVQTSFSVSNSKQAWLPLWPSGQSSWLQIQRSGFSSQHYQIFWQVVGLERNPLSLVVYNRGATWKKK